MKRVNASPTAVTGSSRPHSRRTKKTKYSFLRWLHKRNALLERVAAPDKEKDLPPLSEELMNWADDGGSVEGGSVEQETPTG